MQREKNQESERGSKRSERRGETGREASTPALGPRQNQPLLAGSNSQALLGRGPPALAGAPLHGLAPPRAVAPPLSLGWCVVACPDELAVEAAPR